MYYYYEIWDRDNKQLTAPSFSDISQGDATNTAMESLATMYVPDWPVEVRVFESPTGIREEGYIVKWHTVYQEDVKQYALKKIEEANRKEFANIILEAMEGHEELEDRYSRGLLTPLDFALGEENNWIRARLNIEAKGV